MKSKMPTKKQALNFISRHPSYANYPLKVRKALVEKAFINFNLSVIQRNMIAAIAFLLVCVFLLQHVNHHY